MDEVVEAGLCLLRRRSAVGWTSIFQRCFSLGSSLAPRGLRRRLAAGVMRMVGAK
ncbi:MAG: hypothetical protein HC904_05805 [Blastochloris sp.]|nr:hypothetical protein [Blastochloris sp.]